MSKRIDVAIVGAGHRALTYASYAKKHPERMRVVAVADPIELRRKQVAAEYDLTEEQCFSSAEELAAKGKIADAVINGTMDAEHVATSLPLLEAGYDILLEKPFAVTEEEVHTLAEAVKKYQRKVMICHVLRYAPFYVKIKDLLNDGAIGDVINIQTVEHVSYHHMSVGFIRGKWNSKERCGSSMLLAKCCHDLDLIMWLKSGTRPTHVASFGGRCYFKPENAPQNSGTHCLNNCPIEKECLYSARKHFLDHPARWSFYVWHALEHIENPTLEQKEAYLKEEDNPYSRCVWKCDNDVVDRQSVIINFADGCTVSHNMVGGTSRPMRKLHVIGTKGEIEGVMDESRFQVRHIDTRPDHEYSEKLMDLNIHGDMTGAFGGHGGGDLRLVGDFVDVLQGKTPSISCTSIEDSVNGHLVGFLADKAMEQKKVIEVV